MSSIIITTTKGILYSKFHLEAHSATTIQSFFAQIEIKYGNLSQLLDSPNTPAAETTVLSDGELHVKNLERLFTHDATAIHIPNYYHKCTATKVGMEFLHESQQENNNGEGGRNWKVSTSRGLESSDVIQCFGWPLSQNLGEVVLRRYLLYPISVHSI
jgi:hypothetical protein